nr:PREDICTED: piggyBac transposable element-derived protein 4-like [Megachile rotundata]
MDSVPGPSRVSRKRKRNSSQCKQSLASIANLCKTELNDSDSDLSASSSDCKLNSESESDDCGSELSADESQDSNSNIETHWSSDSSSMQTVPFIKQQSLLVPIPAPCEPLKFFQMILTDEFFADIVKYTNEYAQHLLHQEMRKSSRVRAWKDLTIEELKTFVALLLHTGTVQLPKLNDYWKTHWLFNYCCFSNYMSRNRFLLILRCLHFLPVDVQNVESSDKLCKVRLIIDHFNNTMNNIYYPGKELLLVESMLLWRERPIIRQVIKNEYHKQGIKFYMLTEPDGTIIKLEVHSEAGDDAVGTTQAEKIVLKLFQNKLQCGHSIYMDSFYNSYDLAVKLLNHNTYCTGTLNKGKKEIPKELTSAVLKKGENKSVFCNGVHIGKFRDKRNIFYITTEFMDNMTEMRNKQNVIKHKPEAIVNYNKYMSGVNKQDQMMANYPCSRKTLRWYKKIFVHILQLSFLNSFYLYNKFSNRKCNFYDYKMQVLEVLLPKKENMKTLKSIHRLSKIGNIKQDLKKNIKVTMRKECKMCRMRSVRKDTTYQCNICTGQPGFCVECFFDFHEKQ